MNFKGEAKDYSFQVACKESSCSQLFFFAFPWMNTMVMIHLFFPECLDLFHPSFAPPQQSPFTLFAYHGNLPVKLS